MSPNSVTISGYSDWGWVCIGVILFLMPVSLKMGEGSWDPES